MEVQHSLLEEHSNEGMLHVIVVNITEDVDQIESLFVALKVVNEVRIWDIPN